MTEHELSKIKAKDYELLENVEKLSEELIEELLSEEGVEIVYNPRTSSYRFMAGRSRCYRYFRVEGQAHKKRVEAILEGLDYTEGYNCLNPL